MKITVIVCTHNPRADYFRRTIDSLSAQTFPKEEWELLIVDNGSERPVAETCNIAWHPNGKHIKEPELGLAVARIRGMKEAAADLLVFVDDDNVLDDSYLIRTLEIEQKWPILGVWGSANIVPEYEVEPSDELKEFVSYLALREYDKACWSNFYPSGATPWGAGLCVRRSVADAYRRAIKQSSILIMGRKGGSLMSCEDNEIACVACEIGLGMGVFPELRLTHLISKERVSRGYLLELIEGTEASLLLLAYKWQGVQPTPLLSLKGIFSVVGNVIIRKGMARRAYFSYLRGWIMANRIIAADKRNSKVIAIEGRRVET